MKKQVQDNVAVNGYDNELYLNQLFSNNKSENKSQHHEDYEFYDQNHLDQTDDFQNVFTNEEENQINFRGKNNKLNDTNTNSLKQKYSKRKISTDRKKIDIMNQNNKSSSNSKPINNTPISLKDNKQYLIDA